MMMDLRTAKIVILMIKIEIRDVLNIAVHIVMDLVQDPACIEFLRDSSNKAAAEGGICGQDFPQ